MRQRPARLCACRGRSQTATAAPLCGIDEGQPLALGQRREEAPDRPRAAWRRGGAELLQLADHRLELGELLVALGGELPDRRP